MIDDTLKFRHPDVLQQLPFRDWIRQNLPGPKAGYVVEDLDLVIRVYGDNFSSDSTGKFMLIELKKHPANIGHAQWMTFGLIDRLLKSSPEGYRYKGYYVIQYTVEHWDYSQFHVNGIHLPKDKFIGFLKFDIPPHVPDFPLKPK